MRRPARRQIAGYLLVLAVSFLAAMVAGYTALGTQVDADAYDVIFRLRPSSWTPQSALLTIDEETLLEPGSGGVGGLRTMLADALERLVAVRPKVVAVDLTLADTGRSQDDQRLEAAMRATPNLVLGTEMMPGGSGWQDPLPRFRQWAAAVGHVHAAPGVARELPLEMVAVAGHQRRFALALEAFRLSRGARDIVESPQDLSVGGVVIPADRSDARSIFIRYPRPVSGAATGIPRISLRQLRDDSRAAESLRAKVVFIGVTAQSAARDRLITPYGFTLPGVEIHASAFETLAHGRFLQPAGNLTAVLICAALVVAAGLIFWFLHGWIAYSAGGLLLVAAHALPYFLFTQDIVFPFTGPVFAAWLAVAGAASYQHFVARRELRRAESEKSRYQQAVQFVTHEMRTPLTAIQGSSELIGRYNLGDEKRKEMAGLIHSESRRLARMIETFLSVERLSAGQMELKQELVGVRGLVDGCLERVQPLANRKRIRLSRGTVEDATLTGDRELLEYAFYNLLTNAIKYSPAETEVAVSTRREGERLRLAVQDQGIGMDEKELGNVFQKFYRTRKAVDSGEAGTGIGLSIVNQIMVQHGGKVEVVSAPSRGSCFTLVFPVAAPAGAGDRQ
jgi:signal transduction histidine kinase